MAEQPQGKWKIVSRQWAWSLDRTKDWREIYTTDHKAIVRVDGFSRNGEEITGVWMTEEHARLIAAAPELLALLKEITPDIDCECVTRADCWRHKAEDVIAKAEGR